MVVAGLSDSGVPCHAHLNCGSFVFAFASRMTQIWMSIASEQFVLGQLLSLFFQPIMSRKEETCDGQERLSKFNHSYHVSLS